MLDKIRDSDKSSKVYTSTHQSMDKRDDFYDPIHKENLRMKQYMLNTIALTANNNAYTLYFHRSMKVAYSNDS